MVREKPYRMKHFDLLWGWGCWGTRMKTVVVGEPRLVLVP